MYILQNIKKLHDAKGFNFLIFWVKNRDFNLFSLNYSHMCNKVKGTQFVLD